MKRTFPLAILPLAAVGCAAGGEEGRFPSLLPRAIESRSDEVSVPEVEAAKPDAALDATLARIRADLAKGGAAFDAAFARADRLANAARGGRAGSDAWLDAQVALAELDVLRTDTRLRLAELEQVAIDRAVELAPDYPGLSELIETARAQDARQAERVGSVEARLAPA